MTSKYQPSANLGYMADGIREAAVALFASPAFVISVCLSIVIYFSAWLSLAVGLAELGQVALACLRLYREVEAASTPEELEAASARSCPAWPLAPPLLRPRPVFDECQWA
ncbi:hypothetical protein [Archangium sp.]|uniref:hypothetical protein n=1 Tax=Archangium sp. TaxID=1872627 RepID=UPI002D3E3782|nr:hypothetical protein [Archangium sp.]HYO55207.1 hypothetical protein [Archangium sp.]